MWLKQATIYQLASNVPTSADALEERLSPLAFTEGLPSSPYCYGWIAPTEAPVDDEEAPLAYAANGFTLACFQLEEKILPASVIKQAVDEKVEEIQTMQDRKVFRKEKADIKDEITRTLLPRAFCKQTKLYALIDTKNHLLIVNTASASKLEKFGNLMEKTFNEKVIRPIETKKMAPILTNWLEHESYPSAFGIEKSCLLRDPNLSTRTIRCNQQDPTVKAIHTLINDGFEVNEIALNWLDRITFVLTDNFDFKGIKFQESMTEDDSEIESKQQRFAADFFIVTKLFSELLNELLNEFKADGTETDKAAIADEAVLAEA